MTFSGTVKEIKSGQARNSGKTYYKVFVQSRADGREVCLFAWSQELIQDVSIGKSYDFDVDYSDKDQKFLAINRLVQVTYVDEDRGYPASFDAPDNRATMPQKSIGPPSAPAETKSEPKFSKQDNDIHIVRESALKSAAMFATRPGAAQINEDELVYIAAKFEDYIKNGAADVPD